MKTKNFNQYLEKRLDKSEIEEIRQQANIEADALRSLQAQISNIIDKYMLKEKIGFNELVRRMGVSPSQALKIQRGQANLTLATLAHISGLLGKKPQLSFKKI